MNLEFGPRHRFTLLTATYKQRQADTRMTTCRDKLIHTRKELTRRTRATVSNRHWSGAWRSSEEMEQVVSQRQQSPSPVFPRADGAAGDRKQEGQGNHLVRRGGARLAGEGGGEGEEGGGKEGSLGK